MVRIARCEVDNLAPNVGPQFGLRLGEAVLVARFDCAVKSARRCDPSGETRFIDTYLALCSANNFLGRPDRALELADKAIRLSPRDPLLRPPGGYVTLSVAMSRSA
jgi:hypothetical protein